MDEKTRRFRIGVICTVAAVFVVFVFATGIVTKDEFGAGLLDAFIDF